jgi:hypothetical protein
VNSDGKREKQKERRGGEKKRNKILIEITKRVKNTTSVLPVQRTYPSSLFYRFPIVPFFPFRSLWALLKYEKSTVLRCIYDENVVALSFVGVKYVFI